MKLIYEYCYGDGYTYSCNSAIPFEYESKDKFVFDMLERISKAIEVANLTDSYPTIDFLGIEKVSIYVEGQSHGGDLWPSDIERNTYTLEEWFDKEKQSAFESQLSVPKSKK